MAKIVDPDQLNQGTEVVYDRDAKTIQLLVAGNLDDAAPGRDSGVTGQAVYSFSKEEWLSDATLNELRFPFDPIFEQKLILVNGWKWADAQSQDLLRDVGYQQINGARYAGLQSLGSFNAVADQAYYQQVSGFDATADASVQNFDKNGEVNEAVNIYGPGGTPDYTGFLKVFLREQGKTYDQGELVADQALSAIDYRFYGVPLSNATDLNITESDANIDSNSPYTGMTVDYLQGSGFTTWADSTVYAAGAVVLDPIRQSGGSSNGTWWFTPAGGTTSGTGTADDTGITDWESYAGELQVGTEWYAYNRIIDGNGGTTTEIYEWAQRQLRKTTDINDDTLGSPNQNGNGAQFGRIANSLCFFVGDVLQSADGVAITNFDANATNNIRQNDITVDGGGLDSEGLPVTSTERQYPFVAAGTLSFSQNLVDESDVDTLYKMFFAYSERFTDTDVAIANQSGVNADITSTNIDMTTWSNGDFIFVSGFANSQNNGMWQVNGVTSANTAPAEKVNDINPIDESAGPSVSLDTNPFDSPDAIVVDDNAGADITGQITAANIAFDFDYTNNAQGGRTPNTDADVVVIAQGIPGARWIAASFTITQSTGQSFPVNAADELVYSNP